MYKPLLTIALLPLLAAAQNALATATAPTQEMQYRVLFAQIIAHEHFADHIAQAGNDQAHSKAAPTCTL